jgi:hypothetical protein
LGGSAPLVPYTATPQPLQRFLGERGVAPSLATFTSELRDCSYDDREDTERVTRIFDAGFLTLRIFHHFEGVQIAEPSSSDQRLKQLGGLLIERRRAIRGIKRARLFGYLLKVFGNFYRRFSVRKIASSRLHQLQARIVKLLGVFESVLEAKFDTWQVGSRIRLEIDFFVLHGGIGSIPLVRGVSEAVHFLMEALRQDIARNKRADCYDDAEERDAYILGCHVTYRLLLAAAFYDKSGGSRCKRAN